MVLRRYLYGLIWLAAAVIFSLFIYRIRGVFPPFLFGVVLAYMLNPVVELLEERGFNRLGALLLIYFALAGLAFIVTTAVIPLIIHELNSLAENLPQYAGRFQELVQSLNHQYSRVEMPQSLRQVFDDAIDRGEKELINIIGRTVDGFLGFFPQLLGLLIAPVLAFYMLKDMAALKGLVVNAIPYRYRGDVISLLQEIDRAVGGFIRGHLLLSLIVGTLSTVGLYLLGIDFALLIGVIAGVTNVIPYFGPIIGAIPALLIAGLTSPTHILYVIILFVVIQQAESNIFAPTIIGRGVGLHPLAVIFALLVGGELFGVVGLLLAVPAAAILKAVLSWLMYRSSAGKGDRSE